MMVASATAVGTQPFNHQRPELIFLSNADYQWGHHGNNSLTFVDDAHYRRAQQSTSPDSNPPGGGDCQYWDILTSTHDHGGRYVPTRCGDNTIAYVKACTQHNFCDYKLFDLTIAGDSDLIDISGTRYTYQADIIGEYQGHEYDVTVRVVTDRSSRTARGGTPGGLVVGTITAYCVGFVQCPPGVNTF